MVSVKYVPTTTETHIDTQSSNYTSYTHRVLVFRSGISSKLSNEGAGTLYIPNRNTEVIVGV